MYEMSCQSGPSPRPAPPGFAPALPGSRRVPSHIGDPQEHNRDRPPTHSERNLQLFTTPGTVAYQAPLSMGFSRQEYWSAIAYSVGMGRGYY